MSAVDQEKYLKEIAAQKKRAEALKHLEKEGQSLKGLSALIATNEANSKKGDNTLELLRKQSLTSYQKSTNKEIEILTKNALINQQLSLKSETSSVAEDIKALLAIGWKELTDSSSGKKYYWNIQTNETTWTKPEISQTTEVDQKEYFPKNDSLPDGWVKKIHPSTQQPYYLHVPSNKTSFSLPTSSSTTTTNSESSTRPAKTIANNQKLDSTNKEKKRKDFDIDPLDPTGGMVLIL